MSKIVHKITAEAVAEYFIAKAKKEGKYITNKKLQKLVYYSQAWFLVLKDKKLFEDKIEAWVHGPAIKSLYMKYKKFGFSPIEKNVEDSLLSNLSPNDKVFLDTIWSVYGGLDAGYLEMLTHSEVPWKDAREGLEMSENSVNEISTESMKNYYSQKLATNKKQKV